MDFVPQFPGAKHIRRKTGCQCPSSINNPGGPAGNKDPAPPKKTAPAIARGGGRISTQTIRLEADLGLEVHVIRVFVALAAIEAKAVELIEVADFEAIAHEEV